MRCSVEREGTMISDDERREVAERLRSASARRDDAPWMVEDLMQALGFRCYEDGEDQLFDRLAELIERPTCSMEYRPEWSGDEIYPTRAYECSECGHIVQDGKPDYCPGCGAEVVE